MRTTMRVAPLILCMVASQPGCDTPAGPDTLNGNEFTQIQSRLQVIDDDPGMHRVAFNFPVGAMPSRLEAAKISSDDFDDLVAHFDVILGCDECDRDAVGFNLPADDRERIARERGGPVWRCFADRLDTADLDGDGRSELFSIDAELGELRVYDIETKAVSARLPAACLKDRLPEENSNYGCPGGVSCPLHLRLDRRFLDVNGDGRDDLVCMTTGPAFEKRLTVHLSKTDAMGFEGGIEHTRIGDLKAFGDFDGDGYLDYLIQETQDSRPDSGQDGIAPPPHGLKLAVAYGDGAGGFSEPVRVYENRILSGGQLLAVDDFNGDGVSDLVWLDDMSTCLPWEKEQCGESVSFFPPAEPTFLFGKRERTTFGAKAVATNLDLGFTGALPGIRTADMDGDGAAELILVALDLDFMNLEPFLRVVRVSDGEPAVVSNTRLETIGDQENQPASAWDYQIVAGNFVDSPGAQLLVVDKYLLSRLYKWVE